MPRDTSTSSSQARITHLVVPDDAPTYFREAIIGAKNSRRPIVIDFWADWCVACLRLKRETLESDEVAELLRSVELIYIDLDNYPALGDAYGVVAIPDLVFAEHSGEIVDRLQTFEEPKAFSERLRRLFGLRPTNITPKQGDN